MDISVKNTKKISATLLLMLITLAAGRGLFSSKLLAGHDAAAYPVNQAQFMENLREGVIFPRWPRDTRFGYGQPQLQFRPPLLHYLASPIHAATGNPFLALHLALLVSLFMAAWGAFSLARRNANGGFAAGLAFMLLGVLWPRRKSRKSGSNLTLILNATSSPSADTPCPDTESEQKKTSYTHAFTFSTCAVVLLVGAILLADYLVRVRDDETRAIRAGEQLAGGDNLVAIHSFAGLLRERETDIAARYNLGAAYHNYGWHDEALASYDNVLNLANEYVTKAAHSAARIWLMRKDFESARFYYETALRHRPDAKDIRAEYEQLMLFRRLSGITTKFETRISKQILRLGWIRLRRKNSNIEINETGFFTLLLAMGRR